ncbi:hypothetical protein QOZ80_6AG0531100 [Eleusine coracana subsp. coracana]|nr:hypothetical protein QOZ80_6AG0531100 [Eleusine coracana subsp. coracana]
MKKSWELPSEERLRDRDTEWLLRLLTFLDAEQGSHLALLLWRTWQVRNEITHHEKVSTIKGSVHFVKSYIESLHSAKHYPADWVGNGKQKMNSVVGSRRAEIAHNLRWQPPWEGWVKVNVDGAYSPNNGQGTVGVIIRDASGAVILTTWKVIFQAASAEEVKALACIEGLSMAAK